MVYKKIRIHRIDFLWRGLFKIESAVFSVICIIKKYVSNESIV